MAGERTQYAMATVEKDGTSYDIAGSPSAVQARTLTELRANADVLFGTYTSSLTEGQWDEVIKEAKEAQREQGLL